MAVSRPLTKELLKKLFLKTLGEFRGGGRMSGCSHSIGAVIDGIPMVFTELGKLTDEESRISLRVAFELERDGFIWQDPTQPSQSFKVLSDLGLKVVKDELEKMKIPSIDIDQLIARGDLRRLVRDDFISLDYETAVFKAFRFVEESVRAKASEPPTSIGVSLMSVAFAPAGGKLKHPGAAVASEQEGLHHLMRGAIAWFKNPSSHRTVPRDDALKAAHVLAFANILLDLLDEC